MTDNPSAPGTGPLDQLFPGLRRKAERMAALPVHPRVVNARDPDGHFAIVLASFAPAANLRAYHAALKPLVEAALLSELCRSMELIGDEPGHLARLELYAFAKHPFDVAQIHGVFAFGLRDLHASEAAQALALLRRESQLLAGATDDEPRERWVADWTLSRHPLAVPLEAHLRAHAPREAWGREPGIMARLAADFLAKHGHPGVEPSRAGIEALEAVCVHRTPFVLRGMGAATFQALCDLIAVYAASVEGLDVEWGVCEPDEPDGPVPPPVLRVRRGEEVWHVPVGEHVLRWTIMPASPTEEIPSLGAWAEHEFA
jgi:hypothetical protein